MGGGNWGRSGQDEPIYSDSHFDDELDFGDIVYRRRSQAIQQFWASGFQIPSGLNVPVINGFGTGTLPLLVVDEMAINKGVFSQLDNVYDPSFIGINYDNGKAANINIKGGACGSN